MKDIFSDNSHRMLLRILQQNPTIKDFVKESAESLCETDSESLPSTAFADEINMQFPINNKGMAKLSFYYAKMQNAPEQILTKISEALELFGETTPTVHSGSLSENCNNYLLPDKKAYPANNEYEVKIAQSYFDDYAYSLALADRSCYCKNLLKTAMSLHMDMNDFSDPIKRYAGVTGTDLTKLSLELDSRIDTCLSNQLPEFVKEAYEGIKQSAFKLSTCTIVFDKPRDFEKVAHAIEAIDKESGLDQYYSINYNDPYTAVFNINKYAESAVTIDGESVPYSNLTGITKNEYSEILGKDFADEIFHSGSTEPDISQMKAIIPTLPLDMRRALLRYASGR